MDLGLGFNGSLLDPMKMTDAELLDNPDDDDDMMNGVLLGSSSSVLQTPDKLSLEGQDDASGSNGGDSQMDAKSSESMEAMSAAISNAINPGLEQLRNTAELESKEVEIQSLKETNAKLIENGRELKDKLDLHEDELTDLREQFVAMEKESEAKSKMIESLEKKAGGMADTQMRVKQLEEKIEKDKVDAQALQKRNQDAIGNKNQKIATLNEELAKLKNDMTAKDAAQKGHDVKTGELEQTLLKVKENNESLTAELASVKTELAKQKSEMELQKSLGVSAEAQATQITQLEEEIRKLKSKSSEEKDVFEQESKRLGDLALKSGESEKEARAAHESLKKKLEEQKVEFSKLQADLKEANEAVQDRQMALSAAKEKEAEQKASFDQEKVLLSGELSKVKAAKESLTIERDNISKEKEAISGELLMLQKQKSELDETAGNSAKFAEEKKALSDKCNKLEMEAFELTRTINELKQKVTKFDQLEEQVKEMDGLRTVVTNQNSELQALRAETHTAKEQNSNLLQSNEKLIQTAFENRTNHKNALDNLSRECTSLKKAVNDKEKLLVDARRRVEELEKNRSNEGAMAAQMIPQMQMAHSNEVQQLKRQIDQLSSEVTAWQKWKMEDEKQKNMTNSQVESLTKVLVETKTESLNLKKEVDGKANEIQVCHMRMAELTKNLQMKINECETLKAIEKGMEKVKKETDQSRAEAAKKGAEAEAYRVDAAKWKMAAEKSDLSQKELTKEATKMLKMLQDKDAMILEKDKALISMREKGASSAKDEDTDKKLQEARKDVLILEKESQFQKSKVEQTKREVDFLKKENFKLDKELQKLKKEMEKPQIPAEGSEHLSRELEEVKRQLVKSSSELNHLKKENATTSKKIADLEKENRKVTEKNKQLNAELVDEKAKVMVLCELREEEELGDAVPPKRKTTRAPPAPLAIEKNKKRPKSMPAKMQEKEQKKEELKEEPDVSLIQVTEEESDDEEKVSPKQSRGKAGKGKAVSPKKEKVVKEKVTEKKYVEMKDEKVTEKAKKPAPTKGKGKSESSSSESSRSMVEVEPEVNLVPVARKRGRPEKDPVQEVMEYLARMEKRKGRSKVEEDSPKPAEKSANKVGSTKRKASEDAAEQPPAKRGKGRPKASVEEWEEDKKVDEPVPKKGKVNNQKENKAKQSAKGKEAKEPETAKKPEPAEKAEAAKKPETNRKGETTKKAEPPVTKKAEPAKKGGNKKVALPPKAEPAKKSEPAAKKGKGKESEATKKVEPEVLAPRKGKGTKAAAIIAAITEASDHEAEPEAKKGGNKGKKKTETDKTAPAKKPVRKPSAPPPQPQRKAKKR